MNVSELARLARVAGRTDLADAAQAGVAYTLARQRPDESCLSGKQPNLGWVDGFRTGSVLDCARSWTKPSGDLPRTGCPAMDRRL